jgi:hypothetical protein
LLEKKMEWATTVYRGQKVMGGGRAVWYMDAPGKK